MTCDFFGPLCLSYPVRVLKDWHKEDVFAALVAHGWDGPRTLEYSTAWYYVGEAYSFVRGKAELKLYFVADIGTGFRGAKSIESVAAWIDDHPREYDLWLRRVQDAKWKFSVLVWVDGVCQGAA